MIIITILVIVEIVIFIIPLAQSADEAVDGRLLDAVGGKLVAPRAPGDLSVRRTFTPCRGSRVALRRVAAQPPDPPPSTTRRSRFGLALGTRF